MKKEDFLPYEQSVHLKLMGFDEPCITSYDQEGLLRNPFDYANSEWAYAGSHQQYFSQAEHMVMNSELKSSFTAVVSIPAVIPILYFPTGWNSLGIVI